ncbi:unnamed protein product [Urochloa humidicola]
MQFRRAAAAGSSSSPTAGAASSSPTGWGLNKDVCPFCRVQLVRIRSKQRQTLGQMFVKCPYSVKGDPTTCRFIMSEEQYEGSYGRLKTAAVLPDCFSGDGGDGAVDQAVDMSQELDELKQRVDSTVHELCELRVQVHKLKMTTICVGVGFGCFTTAICGVAIGLAMSRMW